MPLLSTTSTGNIDCVAQRNVPPPMAITLINWKPFARNTLVGFATVRFELIDAADVLFQPVAELREALR